MTLSTLAWGLGLYFAISIVTSLVVGRVLRNVSACYPLLEEAELEGAPVHYRAGSDLGALTGSRVA